MTAPEAAFLGILQGLTEFLPISSSAHLLLARSVLGWTVDPRFGLAFDVAVHVGTLAAVLVYFRTEVAALLRAAVTPRSWFDRGGAGALLRTIAIGTVPVGLIGLLAADLIAGSLRSLEVAGIALAVGAVAMLVAERFGRGGRDETDIATGEAFLLGMAQAAALVPGVSRSGAVLVVAMLLGLGRASAARFAFLLGIPAILAAGGRETLALLRDGMPAGGGVAMGVGFVVSALVGYLAIKYFLRYVVRHSLDPFALYRLALAGGVLARGLL